MVAVRKDRNMPPLPGLCPSPIGWERVAAGRVRVLIRGSTKMPRLRRYGRAGSPLPAVNAKTGAHGVTRPTKSEFRMGNGRT
jgi:hypothetical protein